MKIVKVYNKNAKSFAKKIDRKNIENRIISYGKNRIPKKKYLNLFLYK